MWQYHFCTPQLKLLIVAFAFGSFSWPQAGCSAEKDTDRVFKFLLSGSFVVRESRVLAENFAAKLQAARKEIILSTSASVIGLMFSGPYTLTWD